MERKSTVKKVFWIIGVALFFVSYLPYISVIAAGVNGVQRGFFGGSYGYGFEAMKNQLIWGVIIPVFPICFVYQLVFGILCIRKRKILSVVTLAIVAILIVSALSAGLSFEGRKAKLVKEDADTIKTYLAEKYGIDPDSVNNIRVYDFDDRTYMVNCDVLPKGCEFEVYTQEEYEDRLLEQFLRSNDDFMDEFDAYLDRKYDFPENMHCQAHIVYLSFGGYKDGDDYSVLFESADYEINDLVVELPEISDDIVAEALQDIWKNQSLVIEQTRVPRNQYMRDSNISYYMVNFKVDGKFTYRCEIIFNVYGSNKGTALIETYSDYNGSTALNGEAIKLVR